MKKFYDPEYDRIVDESVPKKQYEWFSQQSWFHKTYIQFLSDNFLNEDETKIQIYTNSNIPRKNREELKREYCTKNKSRKSKD